MGFVKHDCVSQKELRDLKGGRPRKKGGQLSAFYRKTAFTRRSGGSKEGRNLGPDEFQRRETGTRA